jgi:hypothetical protein
MKWLNMTDQSQLVQKLDEMIKLLAIIGRRGAKQSELIQELGELGFGPKRIAELVGTTPNVVSVTLFKNRRSSKSKR